MTVPRASVVIITANRWADLALCLQSVQRQSEQNIEIIVVDNASQDGTPERLAREFPAVRLHRSDVNLGVSEGRNVGIELARSEICICIDDDAFFTEIDSVGQTIGYFESDPSLACVGYTILSSFDGQEEMKSIPRRDKKRLPHDYETTYFCGAGFAVRRSAFLACGRFWSPLIYGSQEIDLGYRFLEKGYRLLHSALIRVVHKSSPTARPAGQWIYFNTRDRAWVAARSLPILPAVTTSVLWWGNGLMAAIRSGQMGSWRRGLVDSWRGLATAWRGRKVLKPETIQKLHALSGRYWY